MSGNSQHKAKSTSTSPMDEKYASLLNDFELVAQAASHDLKDPLRQAVIDFEALIEEYKGKPLDAPAIANIQTAIDAINLVVNRITLIRTYSHVVKNKKPYSEISCNTALQKALETLKPVIESRNAKITAGNLPNVLGNEDHITELFTRLIDNAIKFSPDNTPVVDIQVTDKGDVWQFSVQDNGIGLDPLYRELVFSIFQYLDHESPNQGHGVGLTFCKRIVLNHNGKIWFDSDGENGTCFYFTLPKH